MNYSTKTLMDVLMQEIINPHNVSLEDVDTRTLDRALELDATDPKFKLDKVNFQEIRRAYSEGIKSNLQKN